MKNKKNLLEKLANEAKDATKPAMKHALTLYYIYRSSKTPRPIKAFVVIPLVLFVSPIDLIPDFIPVIGYLDDFLLFWLALKVASKYNSPDIQQHVEEKMDQLYKEKAE